MLKKRICACGRFLWTAAFYFSGSRTFHAVYTGGISGMPPEEFLPL